GDGKAFLHRLSDGQRVGTIESPFPISGGVVSEVSGLLLLWNTEGDVSVWSLDAGQLVKTFARHGRLREARFSETGRTVWVTHESGDMRVEPLEAGVAEGTISHDSAILDWIVEPDGETITFSADGTAKRWTLRADPLGSALDFDVFAADRVQANEDAT